LDVERLLRGIVIVECRADDPLTLVDSDRTTCRHNGSVNRHRSPARRGDLDRTNATSERRDFLIDLQFPIAVDLLKSELEVTLVALERARPIVQLLAGA